MLKHDEIQSPRGSGEPTARGHSPTTAQRFSDKTSFQVQNRSNPRWRRVVLNFLSRNFPGQSVVV